jgi:hypothetical protein
MLCAALHGCVTTEAREAATAEQSAPRRPPALSWAMLAPQADRLAGPPTTQLQPSLRLQRSSQRGKERHGSPMWKLSAGGLLLLAMSGCSAAGGADESARTSAGGIEMAVSQTCVSGTAPECVSVNGEYVMIVPSDFVHVGVDDAEAVADGGTVAVDVRFDGEGAKVFQAFTAEAAETGETARLVIKVGDTVVSAVAVLEPWEGDSVLIALPPDESADRLIGVIQGS